MSEDILSKVGIIVFWIIALSYSVLKFGYPVWFRTSDFIESSKEKKRRAPKWFKFFANSTPVSVDLWIARLVAVMGVVSIIFLVVLLVLILLNNIR